MQSGGYGRKYRVKPRFYIIILIAFGLVLWALLAVLGVFRQARVEWGRLSSDQSFTAIVLRDETVVKATEYSRLSCIAAEGAEVAKDAPVAMLYLSGFSEKDISSLTKLQNDIKDYQENNILKDFVNKGLTELNKNIDAKMNEISAESISHKTESLALAEQELSTYMQQRKAYMLTIVMADDPLNRMYSQETNLQAKIDQTRKTINASSAGLLSYYLDGNESVLTVNSITTMMPVTMKALLGSMLKANHTFQSQETVDKGQPVCRIVNPAVWYAVVVLNSGENPFVQGVTYDVTFDGLPKTVSAKAIKVTKEGGTSLAVLELHDGVKDMLSLRLVNGHLGQDIEGFRVPLSMIKEDNGKSYIALKGSGPNVQRIEVTLLGRDQNYAIIEDKSGSGAIVSGLPLVAP